MQLGFVLLFVYLRATNGLHSVYSQRSPFKPSLLEAPCLLVMWRAALPVILGDCAQLCLFSAKWLIIQPCVASKWISFVFVPLFALRDVHLSGTVLFERCSRSLETHQGKENNNLVVLQAFHVQSRFILSTHPHSKAARYIHPHRVCVFNRPAVWLVFSSRFWGFWSELARLSGPRGFHSSKAVWYEHENNGEEGYQVWTGIICRDAAKPIPSGFTKPETANPHQDRSWLLSQLVPTLEDDFQKAVSCFLSFYLWSKMCTSANGGPPH